VTWEERDHPRHPAETPDSRGGQFREKTWVERVAEQMAGGLPEVPDDFYDDTVYYHGTVMTDYDFDEFENQEAGALVQPARVHGSVIFTSDTDPDYAYVTTELRDAWYYAELAANHRPTGRPRVFRVQATGPVEPDLEFTPSGQRRGIMSHDLRSRYPFEFLEEMEPPEHLRAYDEDEDYGFD
jgi:hypothetical protein